MKDVSQSDCIYEQTRRFFVVIVVDVVDLWKRILARIHKRAL